MSILQNIARNLREVHFGNNWTGSNYTDALNGLSWENATRKHASFNTIATLVNHAGYYVKVMRDVLEHKPMNAKDEWSFAHPPIESQQDWERFVQDFFAQAEATAKLIEQLPESILPETFVNEKYGNYYRNLAGMIEHLHYHLGQIVILRKMLEA